MKKFKNFICILICSLFVIGQVNYVFADDDEFLGDDATETNFNEINALTDFSSYGAADQFESGSTNYLGVSFSDVDDENLQKKLNFISALDIMVGNEGKFYPENNISRGEFVKTIIKFRNLQDMNMGYPMEQTFYDVDPDNIFYKEIYTAYNMNLIAGFNDNTFRPNDGITAEQAITILVRALGYKVAAEENGGYPSGYIYYAQIKGLLKNTSFSFDEPVLRKDVAVMIYNALEANVFGVSKIGHNATWEEGDTALHEFFKISYNTGDIQATSVSAIDGYGAAGDNNVRINNITYSCNIANIYNYLGYNIKYYYYDDGKERDGEIIYFETTKHNEEIVIKAEDYISYNNYAIKYYVGTREKTARIDTTHSLVCNGVQQTNYDESIFNIKNGNIRLLSSNSGSTYDKIFIETFFNMYVSSINMNDSKLTIISEYNSHVLEFDMDETTCELYDAKGKIDMSTAVTDTYDGDGNKIKKYTLPPIPKNSLISVFSSDLLFDGSHYYSDETPHYLKIYINRISLDGSVGSIKRESDGSISEISFAGYKIDVSSDNLFETSDRSLKNGDTGTLWVDYDMKAAVLVRSAGAKDYQYGYLIKASVSDEGGEGELIMKVMNSQGAINKYTINDSIKINNKNYKDMFKAYDVMHQAAMMLDPTFSISQLIKYKLNKDNIINDIQTVTASIGLAEGYSNEQLHREASRSDFYTNGYFGYTLWTKKTRNVDGVERNINELTFGKPDIQFIAPDVETFDEDDYGLVTTWKNDDAKRLDVFDCDDYRVPKAIVAYEANIADILANPFFVVSKTGEMLNEDDDIVSYVMGHNGVKELTYLGKDISTFSGVEKGDLICLYGVKNEIHRYQRIANVYDIADYDYSVDVPQTHLHESVYFTPYEVYALDGNRTMTVQVGANLDNNKRTYQRVSYWPSGSNVLRYGACTCTISGKNLILKASTLTDILDAKSYGGARCSKLYAGENSGHSPKYILIVNKE